MQLELCRWRCLKEVFGDAGWELLLEVGDWIEVDQNSWGLDWSGSEQLGYWIEVDQNSCQSGCSESNNLAFGCHRMQAISVPFCQLAVSAEPCCVQLWAAFRPLGGRRCAVHLPPTVHTLSVLYTEVLSRASLPHSSQIKPLYFVSHCYGIFPLHPLTLQSSRCLLLYRCTPSLFSPVAVYSCTIAPSPSPVQSLSTPVPLHPFPFSPVAVYSCTIAPPPSSVQSLSTPVQLQSQRHFSLFNDGIRLGRYTAGANFRQKHWNVVISLYGKWGQWEY
jgi:hypothetical protein